MQQSPVIREVGCPHPAACPLNQVRAGIPLRIKRLSAAPEVTNRLRELGFCEERQIKLLRQSSTLICQICNTRFGMSSELAGAIWVEPVSEDRSPP